MAAHLKMGRFSPRILMKTIFFVFFFFFPPQQRSRTKGESQLCGAGPSKVTTLTCLFRWKFLGFFFLDHKCTSFSHFRSLFVEEKAGSLLSVRQTSTKLVQPHVAVQSAEMVGKAFMGKSGDRQEKREQAHNCRLSLTAKQLIIITKYKERMENSLPPKETNNLFFFFCSR